MLIHTQRFVFSILASIVFALICPELAHAAEEHQDISALKTHTNYELCVDAYTAEHYDLSDEELCRKAVVDLMPTLNALSENKLNLEEKRDLADEMFVLCFIQAFQSKKSDKSIEASKTAVNAAKWAFFSSYYRPSNNDDEEKKHEAKLERLTEQLEKAFPGTTKNASAELKEFTR